MGIGTEIEDGGRKTGLRVGSEVGRMFGYRDRDRIWWEEDRIESWEGGRRDVWE